MTVSILFILLGLGILVAGGEILVRGATGLAGALGVSPLLIGLVLVGFGTSTPELATSLIAAFKGSPGIAVGNVVGSNIYNTLGILGTTAVVHPVAIPPEIAGFDIWAMLGATALLFVFTVTGWVIQCWEAS